MKYLALALTTFLVATAGSAAAPPCCSLGDVNGDGDVTTRDLIAISKHLAEVTFLNAEDRCNGDVDGDGALTELDSKLIQSYLLGNGSRHTFPRCGDLDGDGALEWDSRGDDFDASADCIVNPSPAACNNLDADQSGTIRKADISILRMHADGEISVFPGCACGRTNCPPPQ